MAQPLRPDHRGSSTHVTNIEQSPGQLPPEVVNIRCPFSWTKPEGRVRWDVCLILTPSAHRWAVEDADGELDALRKLTGHPVRHLY
ncbi:hypothetical protein GCM10022207_61130 [Streptomyces lannensis]|uniref:Uncharacterized protein n=1 Tax=Streptomyces lannensis TaxID=766498 RepID=A0ABP7KQK5_9ACTN